MDRSPPASSVYQILQARTLEWVVRSSSRGSSRPGIEPVSPAWASRLFATEPREALVWSYYRTDLVTLALLSILIDSWLTHVSKASSFSVIAKKKTNNACLRHSAPTRGRDEGFTARTKTHPRSQRTLLSPAPLLPSKFLSQHHASK